MFGFTVVHWAAAVLVIAAGSWLTARQIRVARLRRIARAKLGDPSGPAAQRFVKQLTQAELATYGSLTLAEFVWVWHNIDPTLIRAADFSSMEQVTSGWDFANYIHRSYDALPESSKEGFVSRLEGYVAEQNVATAFERAGYSVQIAESSNQPVWDLLVDGHPVNVKCVASLDNVIQTAAEHPDVTYVVPGDIHAATDLPNVVPMSEFDYGAIKESVKEGVSAAHGEGAVAGLGVHLPIVTVAFAAYRNFKLVKDYGQEPLTAVRHGVIEAAGRGAGVVAGGKIGAAAGFGIGGPLGAVIGGIGMGVLGAVLGGNAAEWLKSRTLRASLNEMESALRTFGESFGSKLPSIRALASARLARAEESRNGLAAECSRRWFDLRNLLWPDLHAVTLSESMTVAQEAVSRIRERTAKILSKLDDIEHSRDWKSLGLMMANSPELRGEVGYDKGLLGRIRALRDKALRERKRLNPKLDLPD